MTVILPPDGSITFIGGILITLAIGFLIGVVARSLVKLGVVLLAIAVVLIALGFYEPNQIIQPVLKYIESGPELAAKVRQVAGYLPYSTFTFIVGLIIGFFKG
jgi:tetrahydromethanopterin S-methyltransferase subunit B